MIYHCHMAANCECRCTFSLAIYRSCVAYLKSAHFQQQAQRRAHPSMTLTSISSFPTPDDTSIFICFQGGDSANRAVGTGANSWDIRWSRSISLLMICRHMTRL